jgi:hypothetical protein
MLRFRNARALSFDSKVPHFSPLVGTGRIIRLCTRFHSVGRSFANFVIFRLRSSRLIEPNRSRGSLRAKLAETVQSGPAQGSFQRDSFREYRCMPKWSRNFDERHSQFPSSDSGVRRGSDIRSTQTIFRRVRLA